MPKDFIATRNVSEQRWHCTHSMGVLELTTSHDHIYVFFNTSMTGGVLSSGGLVKTILPRNRVVCQFMTLYRQIVLIEVQILLQQ